ncbi:MAG: acetyl-CoA carboxylase biotin carboxyl carrier protein subunit, partial [Alphaproteobacteria bacterium]
TQGPGEVVAPMPGKVLEVQVREGDRVEHEQPLLILEAMKMEHQLRAPRAGRVARLAVAVGDQVEEGALLLKIEEGEE